MIFKILGNFENQTQPKTLLLIAKLFLNEIKNFNHHQAF